MYNFNKLGQRFKVANTFNFGGQQMYTMQHVDTGMEIVCTQKQLETGNYKVAVPNIQVEQTEDGGFLAKAQMAKEVFKYIIAEHVRTGEKIEIKSNDEFRKFIEEKGMDFEAVENVLLGLNKTHRKWSLKYAD